MAVSFTLLSISMKIHRFLLVLFLFLWPLSFVQGDYHADRETEKLLRQYDFSFLKDLGKPLTRGEFLKTLAQRYPTYNSNVDFTKAPPLSQDVFTDIAATRTRQVLAYFVWKNVFTPTKQFLPHETVSQDMFFVLMKRLGVMNSLLQCISLDICEQETTPRSSFTAGTYLRWVTKILNKKLRVHRAQPEQYIKNNYKPFLSPKYTFPLKPQTLNGCYFFALRNIAKYKRNIGMHIPSMETYIWKNPKELTDFTTQEKFNTIAHITLEHKKHIETLFTSLQAGEPLALSYILKYKDKKWNEQQVRHVVAAYSFDAEGVRVAETVTNRYVRVPWSELFDNEGYVKGKYMRAIIYTPTAFWTDEEKKLEKEKNFLVGEW